MILKRRVALNGAQLDEIDERILISAVEPADGRETIGAVDAAAGYGQRIIANRRSTVDIAVRFRIMARGRSTEGQQERSDVLEKVNAWAGPGGFLTVNYKPDRRLRVILVQAPGEGSLWDYTKEFQILFRAYAVPYWEQDTEKSFSFGGETGTGSGAIYVEGSAKTQANVTLQNTSGMTVNTANIVIGGNVMKFAGLGLGGNEALVIDHTDDGLVRIRIRSTGGSYRSAMAYRSTDSADDFLVDPGSHAVSYSTPRACSMTASWRARYL